MSVLEVWDLYKCDACGQLRLPRAGRNTRDLCPFCNRPLYFKRNINRAELRDLLDRVPVEQLRALAAAEEAVSSLRQRLIEQDRTGAQRQVAALRRMTGELVELIGGQEAFPW